MRKILISTANAEENRIAVLDNEVLTDYLSVIAGQEDRKLSVFAGVIEEIETSINACFVNIGDSGKKGFLQFADIAEECLPPGEGTIAERLEPGMRILVQIIKDSRSEKGPLLSSRIKLTSNNLVLMPRERNAKPLSVSHSATPSERQRLMETEGLADLPEGHAIIIRSNGLDQTGEELVRQKGNLLEFWGQINQFFDQAKGPQLIYENLNIVNICLTEYHSFATDAIICDSGETLKDIKGYIELMKAAEPATLRLVEPGEPIFDERILRQLDALQARKVKLKSGGEIVIDTTEALVAIDINSKRSRSQKNIEETALNTNIEAATEICLQLRLRNLAGQVVIDFIDMKSKENQQSLIRHIDREFRRDRASITIGEMSKFGLLELTRQNIGRPLHEAHSSVCSHCDGTGRSPQTLSLALEILDRIKEMAFNRKPKVIYAEMPLEPAIYLLNDKRQDLELFRSNNGVEVIIIPSTVLKGRDLNIRTERNARRPDDLDKKNNGNIVPPYLAANNGREAAIAAITNQKALETMHRNDPAAQPQAPASGTPAAPNNSGMLTGISNFLSGLIKKDGEEQPQPAAAPASKPARRRGGGNVRRTRSRGGRNRGGNAAKQGEGGGNQQRKRTRPPRPQAKQSASGNTEGGEQGSSSAASQQPAKKPAPAATQQQERPSSSSSDS